MRIRLRGMVLGVATLSGLSVSSCAPSVMGVPASSQTPVAPTFYGVPLASAGSTLDLENSDRIARFRRLADLSGVTPPTIQQAFAPEGTVPGAKGPVPVVQVVYSDGVFFPTNSAVPLPQAQQVIALIAHNMSLDVPDAAITIVGHTDSTGAQQYNDWLSLQRADSVRGLLISAGVRADQISTLGMGDRQPIATNGSAQGRALNRRVEFLISASTLANLSVVRHRRVDQAYLVPSIRPTPDSPPLSPPLGGPQAEPHISPGVEGPISPRSSIAANVQPLPVEPAPVITMSRPAPVKAAPLTTNP